MYINPFPQPSQSNYFSLRITIQFLFKLGSHWHLYLSFQTLYHRHLPIMLFKSTLLLPALLALGLATAVPGPEVEEDLAARGAEFGDNIVARDIEAEDLAARGNPDCGRYASWNQRQRRCFCHQPSYRYYDDSKICCQSDWYYDHFSRRCCRRSNWDFRHGRCNNQ